MRFIPDTSDVDATGVLLSTRKTMHTLGIVHAPLNAASAVKAYSTLDNYDAEQGGFPLSLDAASTSKALAVTLGTNKSSMWFGTRADGTEALWIDQNGRSDSWVRCAPPTLTDNEAWTVEGRIASPPSTGNRRIFRFQTDGSLEITSAGILRFSQLTNPHNAASSLNTLIGTSGFDDWWYRVAVDGTALTVDVSNNGSDWVSAISATMAAAIDITTNSFFYPCLSNFTSSSYFRGQLVYSIIRDGGVTDPIAAEFTPGLFPAGNRADADAGVDTYGTSWALSKPTAASTDEPAVMLPGVKRFWLPGVTAEYISVPDSAGTSITGDIDLRARLSAADWSDGERTIIGKYVSSGNNRSYSMSVRGDGDLRLVWSEDGTGTLEAAQSTVDIATLIALDTMVWLRATLDVDNGASGNTTTFYYSTEDVESSSDVTTWSSLGTPVIQAGVTSIFDGTAPLELGSRLAGTNEIGNWDIQCIEVWNGIGGTLVERITALDASADASTFTSAVSSATVTINRASASTYHVAVVNANEGFLIGDGVNDFADVVGDDSITNFTAAAGLTATVVGRLHAGAASYCRLLSGADGSTSDGLRIAQSTTNPRLYTRLDDASAATSVGESGNNITYGDRFVFVGAHGSSDHEAYVDGVSVGTTTTAVGTWVSLNPVRLFANPSGAASAAAAEIHAIAVMTGRLSTCDVKSITAELASL